MVTEPAGPSRVVVPPVKTYQPVPAQSFYAAPPKKIASKVVIGGGSAKDRDQWGGAVFDPKAEGALVMQRPPEAEAKKRSV